MYLVFDIGGTHIRIGVSEDGQKISKTREVDTPQDFDEAIKIIQQTASELSAGEHLTKAAGGVRALDQGKTKLLPHPNIPLWADQPLKAKLESVLEIPVFLENDAAMEGLGEAVFGAGKDFKIVGYVSVGTGVGGARIIDGRLDRNAAGFEPGFQIIGGSPDQPEYLEGAISGSALEAKYKQKASEIKDPQVWEKASQALAVGLNNLTVAWSPEIIVLGGGIIGNVSLSQTEEHLKRLLKVLPLPKLAKASLENSSGLYGALSYLTQS